MFTEREQKIISIIISSNVSVTGSFLAEKCGVTDRTIRTDIRKINAELGKHNVEINASKRDGYYVDKETVSKIRSLLNDFSYWGIENYEHENSGNEIPNSQMERLLYICLLLAYSSEYLTLEYISNLLFISKTTVRNEIKSIQGMVEKLPSLQLEISPIKGIRLTGIESSKRILLSKVIYRNIDTNFTFVRAMLTLFTSSQSSDFYKLFDLYTTFFDDNKVIFTDKSILFFTVETILWIDRYVKNMKLEKHYSFERDKAFALPFENIEKMFNVSLDEKEKEYLCDSLSYKRYISTDNIYFADSHYEDVVNEFVEKIRKDYDIDLNQSLNSNRLLAIHINSLIQRIKHGFVNNQDFIKDIKVMYPFSFELATNIIPIIEKYFDVTIDESELSYIAIHLSLLLNEITPKVDAAIVCGNGISESGLIQHNIAKRFSNINIVGTYPVYQINSALLSKPDIKLIVSTIPFTSPSLNVKVIQVSPSISSSDIYKLENYVMTRHDEKELYADDIFSSEFFSIYNNGNEYEILDEMINKLYENNYIDNRKDFYDSVMKREKIFPAIYENIWVPHPLEYFARRTVFSVCILKNNEKINLIILCAVNKNDTKKIQAIFEKIAVILSEKEYINSLINVDSYNSFLKQFNSF